VDIRYGDGRWQVKEVARLRRERAILVCSPGLAARLARPITPAACAEAELIHIMGYETFWETWFRTAGLAAAPTWRGVKVDNSIAALEVAASGHGVALVFEMFARPYLDQGRLVAPVSHGFESDQAHYVVLPDTDTPHAPEALAFRDWLLDEANGEV
jgi:LysR family glycine cleavage system transcriptional activator